MTIRNAAARQTWHREPRSGREGDGHRGAENPGALARIRVNLAWVPAGNLPAITSPISRIFGKALVNRIDVGRAGLSYWPRTLSPGPFPDGGTR
jgi:hypothetical protein